MPVTIPPTHALVVILTRGRRGEGGVEEEVMSAQTRRVAIQEQIAATKAAFEYYAKSVESGDPTVKKNCRCGLIWSVMQGCSWLVWVSGFEGVLAGEIRCIGFFGFKCKIN